ncbi:MAG: SDR family oxidoreductase [Novosphingobium sp.]|nr:SDR family oxidoreductase [Novosphingobium sp.]
MTDIAARLGAAFGLEGKTAVVTGAGSGLAETIAMTLAQAGARVVAAHDDAADAERVAGAIRDAGGAARAVRCDPTDEASVVALFADVARAEEAPDIVVIGAMMQGGVPASEMSARQWDAMYAVNTRGAFLTAREAVRRLKEAGRPGRVIALSTIGSEHPVLVGNAAYGSSKAAVNQMCRMLAYEHAGDGILFNAILPGAIPGNAPKMEGAVFAGGPGGNQERHLLGFGNPADVGWLAVYLAGPSAGYITGQTFVIDGGFQVG